MIRLALQVLSHWFYRVGALFCFRADGRDDDSTTFTSRCTTNTRPICATTSTTSHPQSIGSLTVSTATSSSAGDDLMAYIPPTKPLTERISIAYHGLKEARRVNDPSRELAWENLMNKLLDRYCAGERQ